MQAVLAILIIYFYGVGHPPEVRAVQVPDAATCVAVLTAAKANVLKREEVRDAQGGCITIPVPEPHDKV